MALQTNQCVNVGMGQNFHPCGPQFAHLFFGYTVLSLIGDIIFLRPSRKSQVNRFINPNLIPVQSSINICRMSVSGVPSEPTKKNALKR
jgi:hypothetical protein